MFDAEPRGQHLFPKVIDRRIAAHRDNALPRGNKNGPASVRVVLETAAIRPDKTKAEAKRRRA